MIVHSLIEEAAVPTHAPEQPTSQHYAEQPTRDRGRHQTQCMRTSKVVASRRSDRHARVRQSVPRMHRGSSQTRGRGGSPARRSGEAR
jgi:hypothetical protein